MRPLFIDNGRLIRVNVLDLFLFFFKYIKYILPHPKVYVTLSPGRLKSTDYNCPATPYSLLVDGDGKSRGQNSCGHVGDSPVQRKSSSPVQQLALRLSGAEVDHVGHAVPAVVVVVPVVVAAYERRRVIVVREDVWQARGQGGGGTRKPVQGGYGYMNRRVSL